MYECVCENKKRVRDAVLKQLAGNLIVSRYEKVNVKSKQGIIILLCTTTEIITGNKRQLV
jgi:hypothetical protein